MIKIIFFNFFLFSTFFGEINGFFKEYSIYQKKSFISDNNYSFYNSLRLEFLKDFSIAFLTFAKDVSNLKEVGFFDSRFSFIILGSVQLNKIRGSNNK